MTEVRRRASIVVPAASPRKIETGLALDVDEVVLDLEDAVRPVDKDTAREQAVRALDAARAGGPAVAVRVNAVGSPWCHSDVLAIVAAAPDRSLSLVLPKVETAADIGFLDRLLDGAERAVLRPAPIRVLALIESARGLAGVGEIASASRRLEALVLGYADLAAQLGRPIDPVAGVDPWGPAREAVLVAARAAGLQAIDGPALALDDTPGLAREAQAAAGRGFDGKWVIHPAHVPIVERAFMPTNEQVSRAREVLQVLEQADAGAVASGGEMLDEALAVAARRVLARAGAPA